MEFTAIYNTDSIKGIEYSFTAQSEQQAILFCKRKFKHGLIITLKNHSLNSEICFLNLINVKVNYRTGGTKKVSIGLICYNSKEEINTFKNADELFAKYPPVKMSQPLRNAVEIAFAGGRDKVEYNFGKGNAIFSFS